MTDLFVALSATADEPSFFVALLRDFYNTYINPSEYYEHLNLGAGGLWSFRIVILGIFIGIAIACFSAVFTKRVLGDVVRTVLSKNALSPESALTLEELGLEKSFIARTAVCKSVSVRRVLKCVEEEEFIASQNEKRKEHNEKRALDKSLPRFAECEYKINPYADRFYIPEDMKYMADVKFDKKGSTWLGAVIATVLLLIAAVVVLIGMPHLLSAINDIVGSFKGTPKNML